MKKDNKIIEACIVAAGLSILGLSVKSGMDNFTNKDRKVTVKGLAEEEVNADLVTWPIVSKEVGNDLPTLYTKINATNNSIKAFLVSNGVSEDEISINAPQVIDLNADRWRNLNDHYYRYNITSVITVTSNKVDLIRSIIDRQGELLKEGIAIVEGDYDNSITYEFVSFQEAKARMMEEAIKNAQVTASQFAESSHSKLGGIVSATQGQFSIESRDRNTPYIKKLRVVTTITYALD